MEDVDFLLRGCGFDCSKTDFLFSKEVFHSDFGLAISHDLGLTFSILFESKRLEEAIVRWSKPYQKPHTRNDKYIFCHKQSHFHKVLAYPDWNDLLEVSMKLIWKYEWIKTF